MHPVHPVNPINAVFCGKPVVKGSWRERLLLAGCYLFFIQLPDRPRRSGLARVLQSLVVLVLLLGSLLLFVFEDRMLPGLGLALQGFLNGFVHDGDAIAVPVHHAPSALRAMLLCLWTMAMFWSVSMVKGAAFSHIAGSLVLERERAARQQAEAALRLLKAQIEPHFLFNTLGAVQQLAEGGAPRAAALTADLIVFLRATLGSMRADSIELAEDLSVCDAYLHIMQTRLSGRLTFSIDCPDPLARLQIPSMLLLTLVENAVKHGIEQAPDGGRIAITARRDGNALLLSVSDTGSGFGATLGQGLGLQNVRERLALVYGTRASLQLEENQPRGVVARLSIPLGSIDGTTN